MSLTKTYEAVESYIVKIETTSGSGTGFFFAYNESKGLIGIATALHVVDDVEEWRLPLKIVHVKKKVEVFLSHSDRVILVDYKRDSAVILVPTKTLTDAGLPVPPAMLPVMPSSRFKPSGYGLAWAGYPAIASRTLCLFQGSVSAFNPDNDSYYIDGVAINGVSGGPVFDEKDNAPEIVGIVSAYHYNRQSGGNFPGLLMAHDATHLNKTIEKLKNLDEAKKKAAEAASQQKLQQAQSSSGPSEPAQTKPECDVKATGGDAKGSA